MNCFFVTGTDTDVGKTQVSELVLLRFAQLGFSTQAMKPVAAGCDWREHEGKQQLVNDDALILQAASTHQNLYEQVNPIRLAPPIAPHIAAQLAVTELSVQQLMKAWHSFGVDQADMTLIEGAGGWLLPLNQDELMPEFVRQTGADVLLVVAMRLGCLNHALLTAAAIRASGCNLVGWIANQPQPQPMDYLVENLTYLSAQLDCPLWGNVPYLTAESLAEPDAKAKFASRYLIPACKIPTF